MDRGTILATASEYVCKDREAQYGKPEDNFALIGRFWTEYLHSCPDNDDDSITAHDVAMMMSLLKTARIVTGQPKADNYIDLCGYIACAGEIACKEENIVSTVFKVDQKDYNASKDPQSYTDPKTYDVGIEQKSYDASIARVRKNTLR